MTKQPEPQEATDLEQPPPVIVRTILRNEWTDKHKAKVQMNTQARYLFICSLSKSECNKITSCDSAKEI